MPTDPQSSPFSSHCQLPKNLPTFHLDDESLGPGWLKPGHGEVVRTYWEVFVFQPRPQWRLSAYFTKEGYRHEGRANYRVPNSFSAWCRVLRQMPRKLWRHYVRKEI